MPTEETLCRLCGVNAVAPDKAVCTSCWQLAPGWVKKSFMRGEPVDWSRLLEAGSNAPNIKRTED